MINTSLNRHSVKQAYWHLVEIERMMTGVVEENNPHIDGIKEGLILDINDAIYYLNKLKSELSK